MAKTNNILVVETVSELQAIIKKYKKEKKSIGFTPTLGALHEGHATLIRRSIKENDISVCSIFVNPTQFNESSDLKKYPRTFEADKKLLTKTGCDILFFPSNKEVYPKGSNYKIKVNLEGLDKRMEGAFRPGHFEGVVQVVHRLLEIVLPHKLYMGQKDFQQFTIIQKMIDKLKIKTDLVVCPIKREEDGLAMSSRNRRLPKSIRKKATILYKTLISIKNKLATESPEDLCQFALHKLNIEDFRPEYFIIIDGNTLKPIKSFKGVDYVVACTAVWAGEVRLIDNMVLKSKK